MRVSFFEEFPTEETLQKAASIRFPSTVYLGSSSLSAFGESRKVLHRFNPAIEAAYWPILRKSYWISPFCDPDELNTLQNELRDSSDRLKVLVDLELPILSKGQILRNLANFFSNKNTIKNLLQAAGQGSISVVTAEYPAPGEWSQFLFERLGLSFSLTLFSHVKTYMYYTTFIPNRDLQEKIKRRIIRLHHENDGKIHLALGTIAPGVFRNERILPPGDLAGQLSFFREEGIPEVTVYRLGGLTHEYLDTIMKVVQT